ncbi:MULTISPECIES: ESPR domain-containing protein [unclassified Acinetobacter]|uniref:ESPR domain-containing protein n=1 Tax=unclassified Acinetobacter TaxID=196816 RepID=UPI0035B902DF
MNHNYRVVYNESTQTYTAVAENATSRGKSSTVSVKSKIGSDQPITSTASHKIVKTLSVIATFIAVMSFGTAAHAVINESPVTIGVGATSANITNISIGPNAKSGQKFSWIDTSGRYIGSDATYRGQQIYEDIAKEINKWHKST